MVKGIVLHPVARCSDTYEKIGYWESYMQAETLDLIESKSLMIVQTTDGAREWSLPWTACSDTASFHWVGPSDAMPCL